MNVGSERQVVHPRAMTASLPAAFFPAAEHVSFSGSPRPVPALERLSWPVAMAAVAVVSLSLWVGIGDVVRLILG